MGFRRATFTQGNTNCQENILAVDQIRGHHPREAVKLHCVFLLSSPQTIIHFTSSVRGSTEKPLPVFSFFSFFFCRRESLPLTHAPNFFTKVRFKFCHIVRSGWPNGLRRQTQGSNSFCRFLQTESVLVHVCGRGFESHF